MDEDDYDKFRIERVKVISEAGVGQAATTQEGDDTAPRRDLSRPEEDNE